MKYLIALLTAATGILHVLVGFGVLAGGGLGTNWLLILNGVGYLVLLVLFWTASGNGGIIRWILLVYTLITLVGYFIMGAGLAGGTIPLVIKGIELLLALLLLLYRGTQPVAVSSRPAATGVTTPSVSSPSVGSGMADMPTAGSRLGDAAVDIADDISGAAAATVAGVGAAIERAGDDVADMADRAGDAVEDAYDAAADAVGDVADRVGDAIGDAYDTATDAVADLADRAGDAVDATGEAIGDVADRAGDAVEGAYDAATGVVVGGAMAASQAEDAEADAESDGEDLMTELREYFQSFGSGSEFGKPIEYIEGIGAAYGQKLRAIDINTVIDLIVNGATRRGRKQLSDQSGISQSLILTWVNHVDLFRIKGVAQEYADLLEESGVDTVVELAQRNPANLHKRMIEVNDQKSLVRRTPHASEVQSWVEQAKELRRVIYY